MSFVGAVGDKVPGFYVPTVRAVKCLNCEGLNKTPLVEYRRGHYTRRQPKHCTHCKVRMVQWAVGYSLPA